MTKPLTDLEMIESLIDICKKAIKDFEDKPKPRKPKNAHITPSDNPALGVSFCWGSGSDR